MLQALKFGVDFAISRDAITTACVDGIHSLTLVGDIPVRSRSIVVASGARYRRLEVDNHTHFENRGLYNAATAMESLLCRDAEVIVVGGGNSAGQASIFLSGSAKHVHHLIRGDALESTMSQYLVSRIQQSAQITLYPNTEIVGLEGEATSLSKSTPAPHRQPYEARSRHFPDIVTTRYAITNQEPIDRHSVLFRKDAWFDGIYLHEQTS